MFRPHHPASIEFWLSLSFLLNLYNFLVHHDYISSSKVLLNSSETSLILMLICMGLVVSLFLRSRKVSPKDQDPKGPTSGPPPGE